MNSNGKKLKTFRQVNGLSAKQLGEIIGMSATSVNEWERGVRVIPANAIEVLNDRFSLNLKYSNKVRTSTKSNSTILRNFRKSSAISVESLCSDINRAKRTYYSYEQGITPIPEDVVESLNSLYNIGLSFPKSSKKKVTSKTEKTTKSTKTTKSVKSNKVVKSSKSKISTKSTKTSKKSSFGEKIKAIRTSLGLTLKQFGSKYSVSPSHLYQWEIGKGKFVSLDTIKSLKKDGIDVTELV